MEQVGKLVVLAGGVLVVVGLGVWLLGRMGFRGLPGDIVVEGERGTFVFPIVSCLVISALLTVGIWLWQWLTRG